MGKSNGFYQTIMAQETSILRYIESKDILHSTSKKELTIICNIDKTLKISF